MDVFFMDGALPLRRLFALVPLVLGAAIVAAMLLQRRRPRPSTCVWAGVFAAIELFLVAWCLLHLVDATAPAYLLASCAAGLGGAAALMRDRFDAAFFRGKASWRGWLRDVVLLLGALAFAHLALETAYNGNWSGIEASHVALSLAIIGLVMAGLYFLGQRRGGPAAAAVVACYALGLTNFFLSRFKGAALQPSDFLALGTVASVAGNYEYALGARPLVGLACAAFALGLLSLIVPPAREQVVEEGPARMGVDIPRAVSSRGGTGAIAPRGSIASQVDGAQVRSQRLRATSPGASGVVVGRSGALYAAGELPPATQDELAAARAASGAHGKHAAPSASRKTPPSQTGGLYGVSALPSATGRDFHTATTGPGVIVRNVVLGTLALAAAFAICVVPTYREVYDWDLFYFDLRNSYYDEGFWPVFLMAAQDLRISSPVEFSSEDAELLESRLAQEFNDTVSAGRLAARGQFEQVHPHIVAIMDEAYSDMDLFNRLNTGYPGAWAAANPKDALVSGDALASVHAGGTCNSEFEFLTGASMAYLSATMYPYQMFDFTKGDNLVRQLEAIGYHTAAMHPNLARNWNRETVYAEMGFDDTYFIGEFADEVIFHAGVTDEATFDKTLELLRDAQGPQFILNVTMQNHGGYRAGDIPEDEMVSYTGDFANEVRQGAYNEYVSCINKTDAALPEFLDALRELDEPVVVVFFGDHQPYLSREVNDESYGGEDELTHADRISRTCYFIWANYEVAGASELAESTWGAVRYADDPMTGDPTGVGRAAAAAAAAGGDEVADESASSEADGDAASAASAESGHIPERTAEGFSGKRMDLGINYLASNMLYAIGAPLTDFQKAQLVLQRELPIVNQHGFTDESGTWHALGSPEAQSGAFDALARLQWNDFTDEMI